MSESEHTSEHDEKPPSLLQDIRLIFATILTDPGSSLAYGADALIAVTIVLFASDFRTGMSATLIAGATVMLVYLVAIIVYNNMTRNHVHRVLGGGAFVSSLITSEKIQTPWMKKTVQFMGKMGTGSLLSDFPATQAISLIAGVEALYFIPVEQRLAYAISFVALLSAVQRYGLGNLAKFMIWPVIAFYVSNLAIQIIGIGIILEQGWIWPTIPPEVLEGKGLALFWPVIFTAVAAGATLITGVEVGYASVNYPYHKGKAIRISMWILYVLVLCTYSMQLINFMGLGVIYDTHILVPIQIAKTIGGDLVAVPFGVLIAIMLLLAAQTAQSDFPLEILRASRSGFFPRGIGDTAWRRTRAPLGMGGHHGVYNPRAMILLGILSIIIMYFFPSSHKIEAMYGLAVITAMTIDIASYLLRQIRARKYAIMTILGLLIMLFMLGNIVYNKFFEGAWFIVILMFLYMIVFLFSEAVYGLWSEKVNMVPLELGLSFPAFQGLPVDRKNVLLISKFHPGVIHFLKNYRKSGHMPLCVHFQTDPEESLPEELPEWFENIVVPQGVDTITAITSFVQERKPERVHLIPLLVRGVDQIKHFYFGNSMETLKHSISQFADVQVEYNRERILITFSEIFHRIFPTLKRYALARQDRAYLEKAKAAQEELGAASGDSEKDDDSKSF
ncbi:MAG: KUP/HAK/KT family potassium transporter [bacterium]|nr:KUP/HAK/KT family potassium transporter [bacterium]